VKETRAVGLADLAGVSEGGWRGAGHRAQRQVPSRIEGFGILVWRQPADSGMRSVEVVVGPPGRQACSDVRERGEQRLVEKLVP